PRQCGQSWTLSSLTGYSPARNERGQYYSVSRTKRFSPRGHRWPKPLVPLDQRCECAGCWNRQPTNGNTPTTTHHFCGGAAASPPLSSKPERSYAECPPPRKAVEPR